MAESDEAEVEYCSEHLNVVKEVKIELCRAAYKRMCMLYHPDKRSREKESKASISVGMDATNLFDTDNVKILLKEVINCIGGIVIRSHG
ncbi:unnamed protein product [Porites evermanni]|uniref:J domain-containing protein n=1 Tax=Porites evermanni TaxID=104178 RepID=A0ABN8MKW0_9CNID|nr:unnamed protein product [Porites evermanni]